MCFIASLWATTLLTVLPLPNVVSTSNINCEKRERAAAGATALVTVVAAAGGAGALVTVVAAVGGGTTLVTVVAEAGGGTTSVTAGAVRALFRLDWSRDFRDFDKPINLANLAVADGDTYQTFFLLAFEGEEPAAAMRTVIGNEVPFVVSPRLFTDSNMVAR